MTSLNSDRKLFDNIYYVKLTPSLNPPAIVYFVVRLSGNHSQSSRIWLCFAVSRIFA
jgi:hypothetical protein